MYVFRDDPLIQDNQLVCSSLGMTTPPCSSLPSSPLFLCIEFRPPGLLPTHFLIFMGVVLDQLMCKQSCRWGFMAKAQGSLQMQRANSYGSGSLLWDSFPRNLRSFIIFTKLQKDRIKMIFYRPLIFTILILPILEHGRIFSSSVILFSFFPQCLKVMITQIFHFLVRVTSRYFTFLSWLWRMVVFLWCPSQ